MKPYYSHAGIEIYHGDCREILPQLERPDLICADPPYNYGKDYGPRTDDSRPATEYEAWSAEWFTAARAICSRVVVFCGNGNIGLWYRILKPTAVGCWYKPGNGSSSIIGWEDWEPWLYWHGGNKGLLGGSSVIEQRTSRNETGHPCPKPVGLLKKLLIKCRSRYVIDPFLGSGTTLVAAKAIGVRAVGVEIEERFCELAAKRLSQEIISFNELESVSRG